MSDIAERLRNCANDKPCFGCDYQVFLKCTDELMLAAADEIERLRKDLEAERKKQDWISVKDNGNEKTE